MRQKLISVAVVTIATLLYISPVPAQTLNAEPAPVVGSAEIDLTKAVTFGLWNAICVDTAKCIASTALAKKDDQGNATKLIEVRVENIKGKKTIYVQLPTGLLIKPGLEIVIGENILQLDYLMCGPMACLAGAEMQDKTLVDFKKATDMQIVAVFAPTEKTKKPTKRSFKLSMEGSGAALGAISN